MNDDYANGSVWSVDTQPKSTGTITFNQVGKTVLTITADGRLEPGEGMSDDEFTLAVFDTMARYLPGYLNELLTRAERAEAKLAALEPKTTDG